MDSSNSAPTLFPLETSVPPVTDEEFNLFHSLDRRLYTRLVRGLNRNPIQSMQVMAFWMWLEKEGKEGNLISNKIMSFPPGLLNELAEETVTCLKCIENDSYQMVDQGFGEISLLPSLLSARVGLRTFHENRISVLRGVAMVMNTVCARAFNDILEFVRIEESSRANDQSKAVSNMPVFVNPFVPLPFFTPPSPPGGGMQMPPMMQPCPPAIGVPVYMAQDFGAYGKEELGEVLARNLTITDKMEQEAAAEEQVPKDERTIFLTFSKGYPLSEEEVRDHFTRTFGDIIEDLIMQEVPEDEQILYARMVVRSTGIIDTIVGGSKAKFSINGKHVWARKYVKKQAKSPPRTPLTSQIFNNASFITTLYCIF